MTVTITVNNSNHDAIMKTMILVIVDVTTIIIDSSYDNDNNSKDNNDNNNNTNNHDDNDINSINGNDNTLEQDQ